MLQPQPDLLGVLLEQWPLVLVVTILLSRALVALMRALAALNAQGAKLCDLERAICKGEADVEVIRLRLENAWLKEQLAHEGPGAGFRKAAPPPQALSTRVAEHEGLTL